MTRNHLNTPCYIIEAGKIKANCKILRSVMDNTGAKILLAQKAFSNFSLYPLIGQYLSGAASSGLYEARLAKEHFPGESHVYSAAFRPDDFPEILDYADYMIFNSIAQAKAYAPLAKEGGISIGLRINPEHSTQDGSGIYDPCAPGSRLGVTIDEFDPAVLPLLDGLHFHTLCQQDAAPLLETVAAMEAKFGNYLHDLTWLNLGGGHHITRAGYDIKALETCILHLQETYDVQVYLEPGEAIALNAGVFVTTVLDIVKNGDTNIAILDSSAACHMPDVIEMPYRPPLFDSGLAGQYAHTYRLGGPTCLSGDIIGDYSFHTPLKVGDKLTFGDMAIYTTVKNNTFNGMPLPDIVLEDETGNCEVLRSFGYEDFKTRL